MYFVMRDGQFVNCAGESFRAFLKGELPQLPGEKPTIADWEDHLSTLFPEVRLKTFLEMRGADAGPWDSICALPALWVGLLYDQGALDGALDLVKDWTAEQRNQLRIDVSETALNADINGRKVLDVAKDVYKLAKSGLVARENKNFEGFDESVFLNMIKDTLDTGKTPAEHMLDAYNGPWDGDITKIYTERLF